MKIIASDADEPGHKNSQIAYSLIDQNPPHNMFYMVNDGTIYVNQATLDREVEYKPFKKICFETMLDVCVEKWQDLKFWLELGDQCQSIQSSDNTINYI